MPHGRKERLKTQTSSKDSDDTEENKQEAKTKTQFSNAKMRVLQKNLIILHLLVDSMSYTSKFMLQILGLV